MKKICLWIFGALLGTAFLAAAVFFTSAFLFHPYHVPVYDDEDDTVYLEKENESFVILNLTDIQLADLEDIPHFAVIKRELDELVTTAKPDLITVTGDLVWSNENNISLHALIRWLESYEIPWAPVLGNHDLGNSLNSATAAGDYFCYLLESAPHCLFRHGQRELGVGNYTVVITENGAPFKALYFLDTGNTEVISQEQIAWFEAKALSLSDVEGMVFTHKPLSEYADAYLSHREDAIGTVLVHCSLNGVESGGLFDALKAHHVTDVVCGHQHTNMFTIPYEGIRLTFGVKTGELSFYWDDGEINANGGTVFTLREDTVTVTQLLVDGEKYHIRNSDNQYLFWKWAFSPPDALED